MEGLMTVKVALQGRRNSPRLPVGSLGPHSGLAGNTRRLLGITVDRPCRQDVKIVMQSPSQLRQQLLGGGSGGFCLSLFGDGLSAPI